MRKMDYHLHTIHSMDGLQTMDELCSTMVKLGVDEICLTEHIEPGHPVDGADIPPIWDSRPAMSSRSTICSARCRWISVF